MAGGGGGGDFINNHALARKTNAAPRRNIAALKLNAVGVPQAVQSAPTTMLEIKSPKPLTVARTPKAVP